VEREPAAPGLHGPRRVLRDRAFYYFDKQQGAGGLPTGVSGRVACLMSGGIDSPVAAWRMMRRGCRVQLIHFHSYPIVSAVSQEKRDGWRRC
jgi:thiamine biosynthesis protein ThiI